jgi:NTP pyrophosphatase (non-canonical NTP hydrolase)
MKDVIFDDFQNSVCESLLRHRSILDIMTKLQESEARINRAVAKSVTTCGCVKIEAIKQEFQIDKDDMDMDMETLKTRLQTHMKGSLCENCRDVVEEEIGNNLFYLTSLCNLLDLNLYDILLKEYDKINTLGKFTLR